VRNRLRRRWCGSAGRTGFIEHATTVEFLREKHGLTVENVMTQVKALLGEAHAEAPKLAGGFLIRAANANRCPLFGRRRVRFIRVVQPSLKRGHFYS